MADKKLSEFPDIAFNDISKIIGLYLDSNQNPKNGKIDFTTFHQALLAEVGTLISANLTAVYPVGSVYIGTQATCPLATLIDNSTWELVASNKALWTGDGTNANTVKEAGLPNITGQVTGMNLTRGGAAEDAADSALYHTQQAGSHHGTSSATFQGVTGIYIDASRNNQIYGNSDTVQPPAYIVNVWRRTA